MAASDTFDTWQRNLRTFPCFNTTKETIPPYAIMQLRKPKDFKENKGVENTVEKDNFAVQHLSGGRVIWDVTRPNEEGASRQCAEDFVFNGPIPIDPQQPGVCTQDFPCQVLHNGDNDRLLNGQPCGPVKDLWYIKSGGSAFTCKSHDIGFAAGRTAIHTVWIDRSSRTVAAARGRFSVSATDLAVDAFVAWGVVKSLDLNITPTDNNWLVVNRDGLYLVSFHGKLTSSNASRGEELSLTLYTKAKSAGNTQSTPKAEPYVVARDQDKEKDNTGADIQTTAENVAFCGFVNLSSGDGISLKNTCSKLVTLTKGMVTMLHYGNKIDDPPTSGGIFDTSQS